MSAFTVNTRGRYFGGLANVAQTDVFDLPAHDPDFDSVAHAATDEMIAVLASDLELRREEDTIREFLAIEIAA